MLLEGNASQCITNRMWYEYEKLQKGGNTHKIGKIGDKSAFKTLESVTGGLKTEAKSKELFLKLSPQLVLPCSNIPPVFCHLSFTHSHLRKTE